MKHPNEMSAAAINRELDAIDKKQSVLLDEFIAAGRGHERPSDWRDKTDPLSMKEKALSARRFDLMFEVRSRAGPGMYRLPKGFGPMKNPTTRKPGTVAAINRQIDAINAKGRDLSGKWSVPMNNGRRRIVSVTKTGRLSESPYDIRKVESARRVKNPARSATLVAKRGGNPTRKRQSLSKTEYEVQYSRDGSSWEKWTSVLYEDMATAIAKRTAAEFPKYHVRVIRRA